MTFPTFSVLSPVVRRRWIFLAFLLALHMVFLQEPANPLGQVLFLTHIGLGLLWQPFVHPRRRLGLLGTITVLLCAGLFAYLLNWGLLALWVMLLTGVVGGKVFLFPNRWERLFHLMALGYLVTAVLALILPKALAGTSLAEPALIDLVIYLTPVGFLIMAALPLGQGEAGQGVAEHGEIVDFVYGVFVFLLLAVIVLGSLSYALLFKAGYFEALLVSLTLVSGILLLLGWIWNPRAGFGGLGSAMAQHVMSLGLPIEDWLQSLAKLAKSEKDPESFLNRACAELPLRMPGVVGGSWQESGGRNVFGEQMGHVSCFVHGSLAIGLVTRAKPSPSLLWYYGLTTRLLAEFHLGKWRAQELQRLSYVEAIHETGARLTHDVKNLLQSLDTLCVASQQETEPSKRFNDLMRRQLPEISSRLRLTLSKLSDPAARAQSEAMPATTWFSQLAGRYLGFRARFTPVGDLSAQSIPDVTLFTTVTENLLQNFSDKQHAQAGIEAEVQLGAVDGLVWLECADTGSAIPTDLATRLFSYPVPSRHGLGVGLYQSARLAEQKGYRLELAENRDGCVRFRLSGLTACG